MLTDPQHPITPPPELVQQWRNAAPPFGLNREAWIAAQSANWGDEQRLKAVCEWLDYNYPSVNCAALRAAMRPKPPSLAEQALGALEQIDGWAVANMNHLSIHDDLVTGVETIHRALERLQELEKGNE